MASGSRLQEERSKTNPVFNDRKLKLGTFGTNLDRGCAISTIDGVLEINWPNTLELAKISEEMEFEALVPIGRWHGFAMLATWMDYMREKKQPIVRQWNRE
jgi:hypothetical protein